MAIWRLRSLFLIGAGLPVDTKLRVLIDPSMTPPFRYHAEIEPHHIAPRSVGRILLDVGLTRMDLLETVFQLEVSFIYDADRTTNTALAIVMMPKCSNRIYFEPQYWEAVGKLQGAGGPALAEDRREAVREGHAWNVSLIQEIAAAKGKMDEGVRCLLELARGSNLL